MKQMDVLLCPKSIKSSNKLILKIQNFKRDITGRLMSKLKKKAQLRFIKCFMTKESSKNPEKINLP